MVGEGVGKRGGKGRGRSEVEKSGCSKEKKKGWHIPAEQSQAERLMYQTHGLAVSWGRAEGLREAVVTRFLEG